MNTLNDFLPSYRAVAPRKKLRGRKRYIKKVLRRASLQTLSTAPLSWYDQWHYHPDWHGYGNLGWRMREPHLFALAIAFGRFAKQLEQLEKPFQLWIYVNAANSVEDAVFVHTQNPNRSQFPVTFGKMHWGIPRLTDYFGGLLPERWKKIQEIGN